MTSDDAGVAAVIGAVALLAIGVSIYAYELNTAIPRYGAEAERAWDAQLGTAAAAFATGIDSAGSPVSLVVPQPPKAKALDVLLLGRAEPAPPDGSVAFDPDCGSVSLEHEPSSGPVVDDLVDVTSGCLRITTSPVFTDRFDYVVELGAVLRVEDGRAIVLSGPPLELDAEAAEHVFALTLPILDGHAVAVSSANTGVPVDGEPKLWTNDEANDPNAERVQLTFTTENPEAWTTWWSTSLENAGFDAADYSVGCVPAACTADAAGLSTVEVELTGPGSTGDDVVFSLNAGSIAVDVG